MSLQPAIWRWKDHYKGSTFSAKKIKFNFDITGAVITCQIKSSFNTKYVVEWKTGVSITVINPLTGEIVLNQINTLNLPAGEYIWDLQIVFANGTSETYLKGNQKVIQQVTT